MTQSAKNFRILTHHPILYERYANLLRNHAALKNISQEVLDLIGIFDYDPASLESEILIARINCPELRPIILLKEFDEEEGLRWLLRGVWGIVSYERHNQDLGNAVRHVAAGQLWYPAAIIRRRIRMGQLSTSIYQATPWTLREREALSLLVAGYSNRTIAEKLRITPRTAQFHVSNILSKLGFASRQKLLASYRSHPQIAGEKPNTPSIAPRPS